MVGVNDEAGAAPDHAAQPELCFRGLAAPDAETLLAALSDRAEQAGYVRSSFRAALIERERAFPTGLPTSTPVAIPHADVEHVLRPGLGVALLDQPVDFGEMGGSGSTVPARVAVLLLVTQPHEQLDLLVKLIAVFQSDDWYSRLSASRDDADLAEIFNGLLVDA